MILVTGGTGFLGAQLVAKLSAQGHTVVATKRKKSTIPPILQSINTIEWRECNIQDYVQVESALEGIHTIFHCAAYVSFNTKHQSKIFETNVEGTKNIVNAALKLGIANLYHVSSIAALGVSTQGETTEKESYNPEKKHSSYAQSKYLSELEVWRGFREGLKGAIVNPSIIVGPSHDWSGSTGSLIKMAAKGRLRFTSMGKIGVVDVQDVADVLVELHKQEVFDEQFILNGTNLSYAQLIGQLNETFSPTTSYKILSRGKLKAIAYATWFLALFTRNNPLPFSLVETLSSDLVYSNAKIKAAINFEFKPFMQTLADTKRSYFIE